MPDRLAEDHARIDETVSLRVEDDRIQIQLGDLRANQVCAQDFSVAGVHHHLGKSLVIAQTQRFAICLKGEAPYFDGVAAFLCLRLGQSE